MAYGIEEDYRQCQFELSITQTKVDQLEEENAKLESRIIELEKEVAKISEESIFNFPAGTKVLINNINNAPKKRKKK